MSMPTVFISYSHEDEMWKDRLVQQLQVLEEEGHLKLWTDREIEAEDDWYQRIQIAMEATNVAILLISAYSLTSPFIREEEVVQLLERRDAEGLRIFPVIVRPCLWDKVNWLTRMQVRPKDNKALSALDDNQVDVTLTEIAREIATIIDRIPHEEKMVSPEPSSVPSSGHTLNGGADEDPTKEFEMMRRLFTSSSDMLCFVGLNGFFQKLNPAFEQICGFTTKEFLARPFGDFIHPGDLDATDREYGKLVRGTKTISFNNRYLCKDGSYKRIQWNATPFTEDGVIYAVGRDITQRKQREEELRKTAELYRFLFKNAGGMIAAFDLEGKLTEVNNTLMSMLGWSREEVMSKHYSRFLTPVSAALAAEKNRAALAGEELSSSFELELVHKEGPILQVEAEAWIIRDQDGEPTGFQTNLHDITELKQASQELEQFFETSLDLLCFVGFDGYFKRVNPAWEHVLGFTAKELLEEPFQKFIHGNDRKATSSQYKKILGGAKTICFENRYRCKNGSYKRIQWNATPLDGAQLIHAVGRDITKSHPLRVRKKVTPKKAGETRSLQPQV